MSRRTWIIVLVLLGIVAAVLIGIWAVQKNEETKPEAVSALCDSLHTLDSSVQALTSLPSSATKSNYESAVTSVENAWDQVKADAQEVQDADTGDLDSAWDDFKSTLKDVPDDDSVSAAVGDVTQSGDALISAATSTASEIDCSSSS
jgi:hypothetical protein